MISAVCKRGAAYAVLWGVLLSLIVFVPQYTAAQGAGEDIAGHLEQAFNEGSARMLLAPAASQLEISLFGSSTVYSRGQALYVMQDFFQEHPPRRFGMQESKEKEDSHFLVGNYWHEGADQPLWVYLHLRSSDGEWTLREIRIEQREE